MSRSFNAIQSIEVKLLGAFKTALGKEQIILQLSGKQKLATVIHSIAESSAELKRVLLDSELEDSCPNAIIIVNGKTISVLNGLDTEVGDGDKIVLVPAIHGG